jgi:hypothetical protein
VAFEGFACHEFEPVGDTPARSWLRADVSIECGTPEHASVTMVAWVAIVLYPIGVWLGCLVLLWNASTAIMCGELTPFSRSISFLYKEYQVTTYWCELIEMLRKFLLIGLMVIVCLGNILQIAIGTMASAAYLVSTARLPGMQSLVPFSWLLQSAARTFAPRLADAPAASATICQPFRVPSQGLLVSVAPVGPGTSDRQGSCSRACSNYLAQGSSFGLLMVFFCCVLYKYESLADSDDVRLKMSNEQVL